MKVIVQLLNKDCVIHTSEIQVYPLLALDQIHNIDVTPLIQEILAAQRRQLLPAEAHQADIDMGPQPG